MILRKRKHSNVVPIPRRERLLMAKLPMRQYRHRQQRHATAKIAVVVKLTLIICCLIGMATAMVGYLTWTRRFLFKLCGKSGFLIPDYWCRQEEKYYDDDYSEMTVGHINPTGPFSFLHKKKQKQQQLETRKAQKQQLVPPSFENGGIIFFLHIPKTGGESVRQLLTSISEKMYIRDAHRHFNFEDLEKWKRIAHRAMERRAIVSLELHTAGPSFMELIRGQPYRHHHVYNDDEDDSTSSSISASVLYRFREWALHHDIPLWTFTVVREPVSYAVSFFNYYHGSEEYDFRDFDYLEKPTERDFVQRSFKNPQCQFLRISLRTSWWRRRQEEESPIAQYDHCQDASNALIDTMDWIGTTDQLTNQTYVLLKYIADTNQGNSNSKNKYIEEEEEEKEEDDITDETDDSDYDDDNDKDTTKYGSDNDDGIILDTNNFLDKHHKPIVKNKSPPKIVTNKLSDQAIAKIRRMSKSDQELYERVRQIFVFQDPYEEVLPSSTSSRRQ